jgi:hypothetical protein
MADSDKYEAFLTFLRRAYKTGLKSQTDIEAMALDAALKMVDGTTLLEITFEGGGNSRSVVSCDPSVVSLACEDFLKEIDPANQCVANADPRVRYLDMSGGHIEP